MKKYWYIPVAFLLFYIGINNIVDTAKSRVELDKIELAFSQSVPQVINVVESHNDSETYGHELMKASAPLYDLILGTISYISSSISCLLSATVLIINRTREAIEDFFLDLFNLIFS